MIRRREFIRLLGGAAAAWPIVASAQEPARKVRRIGILLGSTREGTVGLFDGFLRRMRELGYIEGKDFVVEWRYAEGNYERFSEFAAEMVRLKAEVIVLATPAAVRPVQEADELIRGLGDDAAEDWVFAAHDAQLPPPDLSWCWLFLGGRGAGKSHSMSAAVHTAVRAGIKRIHFIAPTTTDFHDVNVEGKSGIFATCGRDPRPRWV